MDFESKVALYIAKNLSQSLSEKIARQTIRWLQNQGTCIDKGCLISLWDDVCYLRQGGDSHLCAHYNLMLEIYVMSKLEELDIYEFNAIWLQTDDAYEHLIHCQENNIKIDSEFTPMRSQPFVSDVSKYIVNEYIYEKARHWQNDRLRQIFGYF